MDYPEIAVFAGATLLTSMAAGRLANRLPTATLRHGVAGLFAPAALNTG